MSDTGTYDFLKNSSNVEQTCSLQMINAMKKKINVIVTKCTRQGSYVMQNVVLLCAWYARTYSRHHLSDRYKTELNKNPELIFPLFVCIHQQ